MKNNNLLIKILALFLASFFLLSACSTTVTDALDREVSLNGTAKRIVSMGPSITEILFAIGAGDQVIGRDEFSNYPEEALEIESVGGSWGEWNFEKILELEPDLVLAPELVTEEQVAAIEDLGLTVYYLANPTDLEGMYEDLLIIAEFTGHTEEAEALIEGLRERVDAVLEIIAGAETTPLVFYELDSTTPSDPYTAGKSTFVDTLITMAGGINMGGLYGESWVTINIEEILAQDPFIIILGDSNYGITAESVPERAGWDALTAVQEGRVFPFNDDLVSRPGPRLVDGLEALAKLLHPELFE